jgi:hypothetical protein
VKTFRGEGQRARDCYAGRWLQDAFLQQPRGVETMGRERWTRAFVRVSAIAWGVGLGAKLFDLLVLASAWGASPPASLALYPYGPGFPINPGTFFQPLSALLLLAVVGALICGWKTPSRYRLWLWVPLAALALIWIATPTVFWPMIDEIYNAAHGRIGRSDVELAQLVRRWMIFDWMRVAMIAAGFLASLRALSLPYPRASGADGVAGRG